MRDKKAFFKRHNYEGCFLMLFAVVLCCACKNNHHVTPSFYYWKTVFAPTPYELERLRKVGCARLYVRCFDVARDRMSGDAKPVAVIRNLNSAPEGMQIVPVVFITQEALERITPNSLATLSHNIDHLLSGLFRNAEAAGEVQMDCDWTDSARDAYFALLKSLRSESFFKNKILSATIRMHQVKYRSRSGIPPADRGLLMCYNIGNIRQPGTQNSILQPGLAKDYLRNAESYPLPLDIGLPLFSWCLQFRAGKLKGILHEVSPESLIGTAYFRRLSGSNYECSTDTSWQGYAFEKGDIVRSESPSAADILEVAHYTAAHIRTDSLRVILFHTDSLTLAKHPAHEVEAIFDAYR